MTYNPSIPQSFNIISQSQGQLLVNFGQLDTQFGVDHVPFNKSGSNGTGFHKKVTMEAPLAVVPAGTEGIVHTTNGTGLTFNGLPIPFYANTNGDFPMIPDLVNTVNDYAFKMGNIIFNCGFISPTPPAGNSTATFKIPFTTAIITVQARWVGAQTDKINIVSAPTLNDINISWSINSGSQRIYYFVMGY